MSVTLLSIIETKWRTEHPTSRKQYSSIDEILALDNKEPGNIFIIRNGNFTYDWYKWDGEKLDLVTERKYTWKLLKWTKDTGEITFDVPINGRSLRDTYFGSSTFSPCSEFLDRPIPCDCGEETRSELEKLKEGGAYGFTNVTLRELMDLKQRIYHDLKKNITNCAVESELLRLNVKLDHALELLGDEEAKKTSTETRKRFESEINLGGNPEYFYTGFKENLDYLFGESMNDFQELDNEISKITSLCNIFYEKSYLLDPEDIRIYYYKC